MKKQREQSGEANPCYRHGLRQHPLYNRWRDIKTRCTNPNVHCYHRYGGRGITMCDEWLNDFQAFYDWAIKNGWEQELEIDREDNNGPYSPHNCRFVTGKQNGRNKRNNVLITYNGETKTIAEWGEVLSLKAATIRRRHKAGYSVEKMLCQELFKPGKGLQTPKQQ